MYWCKKYWVDETGSPTHTAELTPVNGATLYHHERVLVYLTGASMTHEPSSHTTTLDAK